MISHMDIRRVKYKQRDAILVRGVIPPSLIEKMEKIAPVVTVPDGCIVQIKNNDEFNMLLGHLQSYGFDLKAYKQRIQKQKEQKTWNEYIESTKEDRDYADKIKNDILTKQKIYCPDGLRCLMNHQKAGVLIAKRFPYYGFFYDTGTGKTLLALQIIKNKLQESGAVFLVICPKSIIQTAWMDDCKEFFPKLRLLPLTVDYTPDDYGKMHFQWAKANGTDIALPGARFFKLGNIKERTAFAKQYLAAKADCFIVNPERFLRNPEDFIQIQTVNGIRPVDGIIVDESSRLKNPDNMLTRKLKELRPQLKYLYLLSGKPAPNRIEEYIPQLDIIDPKILPPGYKSLYYYGVSDFRRQKLTGYINMASITVSKADCFDLPETTEVVREIELSPKVQKQYIEMKYQMMLELEQIKADDIVKKTHVYANHVLACLAKLRQISGGFIYDGKEAVFLHDAKTDEVVALLDELGNEPVLIWCQYQHEIEHLRDVLESCGYSVATAFGKTKDLNANIYSFKEGISRVMIANPRTLQYGVTLTNCCYAIYYSTSYSYEEYYQSHDRIYRKGQSRPCTYIFLQCKNTIDKAMFNVIKRKQSQTEMVEYTIKHIYNKE